MEQEPWYTKAWRPALAFVFLACMIFDFLLAPGYLLFTDGWQAAQQWMPNMYKENGLILWMIAPILGLYYWGRTQEKKEMTKLAAARLTVHGRPTPNLLNE